LAHEAFFVRVQLGSFLLAHADATQNIGTFQGWETRQFSQAHERYVRYILGQGMIRALLRNSSDSWIDLTYV
jgi:hypothetical protein